MDSMVETFLIDGTSVLGKACVARASCLDKPN